MAEQYIVEAVLTATDRNYTSTLDKAGGAASQFEGRMKQATGSVGDFGATATEEAKKTSKFTDTMLGMMAAKAVMTAVSGAWNMVTSSVDKAMKRIDTMEQFRRVIELMTGDSEAAAQAVEKINAAAKGTPYGLDVMSAAVQGLVTAGTELDTAIDYVESWGNAVAVYSDGTNTSLQAITDAISKTASKGKVYMNEINTLAQHGIPAMQIFSEATGRSVEDIQEAMRKGGITADEFLSAMNTAFTEGTERFPALTNAAKEAGSSWAGTFDNMKAATTRGVQAIINSIEDAREAAGLPTMKQTVAEFGKSMEKILKKVADVAAWVATNFETLAKAVAYAGGVWAAQAIINKVAGWLQAMALAGTTATAATTANTAATVANTAVKTNWAGIEIAATAATTAGTAALSAKTVATGIMTAAQTKLNAAISANPIGVAIGAAAAMAAGLTALSKVIIKHHPDWEKLNAEAGELASTLNDVNNTLDSSRQEFKSNSAAMRSNEKQATELIGKIKYYEGAVKRGENRSTEMRSALEKLKKIYPELEYEIDSTTGAIYGGAKGIEDFIKGEQAFSRETSLRDHLMDSQREFDILTETVEESKLKLQEMEETGSRWKTGFLGVPLLTQDYKDLRDEIARTEEQLILLEPEITSSEAALGLVERATEIATQKQEEYIRSLEYLREEYGLGTTAIVQYADIHGEEMDKIAKDAAKYAEEMGVSSDEVIQGALDAGMSVKDYATTVIAALENADSAYSDHFANTMNGWSKMEEGSSISMDEFIENLKHNQDATKNWSDNMRTLMQAGVSDGIIAKLNELGVDGAVQVQAWLDELVKLNGGQALEMGKLTDAAQAKMDELSDIFDTGIKVAGEAAETSLMAQNFKFYGEKSAQELIDGAESKMEAIRQKGRDLVQGVATGSSAEAKVAHVDLEKLGKESANRYVKGIADKKQAVTDAGKSMIKAAAKQAKDEVGASIPELRAEGMKIGEALTSGIKKQTTASIPEMRAAGTQVGDAYYNGIKSKEDHIASIAAKIVTKSAYEAKQAAKTGAIPELRANGIDFGEAYRLGMEAKEGEVRRGGKAIPESAKKGALDTRNEVNAEMKMLGSNAGKSYYDGLKSWEPKVNQLGGTMGKTVEKGIRSALQMRSPSRIMQGLAQDTGAGYINELIKQIDEVERLSMAFGAAVVPDMGMVDREINKATVSVAQDVSVVQRQSATFNLTLGNRTFRAFVDDISGEQSRTAELEEVYAV